MLNGDLPVKSPEGVGTGDTSHRSEVADSTDSIFITG